MYADNDIAVHQTILNGLDRSSEIVLLIRNIDYSTYITTISAGTPSQDFTAIIGLGLVGRLVPTFTLP